MQLNYNLTFYLECLINNFSTCFKVVDADLHPLRKNSKICKQNSHSFNLKIIQIIKMEINMKKTLVVIILTILLSFSVIYGGENNSDYNKNWPTWRGPLVTGEVVNGNPPVIWSETKNIRWKIPVEGKGLSTPVIWGNQIFITSAKEINKSATKEKIDAQKESRPTWMKVARMSKTTEKLQQFNVMSINRKDGKILWQKTVQEDFPHEGIHIDNTWASGSCVTDGKYLVAFFGSNGLFCLDLEGNLLWEKDLGKMKSTNTFGEGSSPALYKDFLIVNWDHEEQSFIEVFEVKSGKSVWKKERDEITSWATPVVIEVNGKPQVIICATGCSRGYNLTDGSIIWELSGQTTNVIPTPVYAKGIIYLMSGYRGNTLQAVKLDGATGDLQGTDAVVWSLEKNTSYVPSSLLYKNKLFFMKGNKAQLTCADALTGEVYYTKQKLDGMKGVYASPVGVADRVYITGRNGMVYVIKSGNVFEMLAKNELEDGFDASPAVVGNELFLRGLKYLYCIAE